MSVNENLINETHLQPEEGIPNKTEWYVSCKCCCKTPCLRLKNDPKNRVFWGFLELGCCMQFIVVVLALFPVCVFAAVVFIHLSLALQIVSTITILFCFIMFFWAYFGASCSDPGFLPYDWIQTQKYTYSWEEQLSGLAITKEQVDYACNNRPKFASFSRSSGRFVIRADHICGWINNWVGKRNHKQFMLMALWGGLYCIVLLAWHVYGTVKFHEFKSGIFILNILSFAFEFAFGTLLIWVFIQNLIDLKSNTTKIQKWKHERGQQYSFCQSMREVCGKDCFFMWLVPTHAFDENMTLEAEEIPQEAPDPTY
ncbi:DHHC zinc finger domain containing protein [Histomonas meleagridis]|uniref:DHHC zinc finger domain containing protein n=1 Tax=Histomonas meleagridis TaxID=135588 RepID=UPI00355A5582|nr:DHHC zinc finger domain containing protein [Histomonas meleagridis]KAH0797094.1 DHHC zinc finger domain containing protein [Histomonas meleagridis]